MDMDLWNSLTCTTPKTENTASQYVLEEDY